MAKVMFYPAEPFVGLKRITSVTRAQIVDQNSPILGVLTNRRSPIVTYIPGDNSGPISYQQTQSVYMS
jgi:hypothetical protein